MILEQDPATGHWTNTNLPGLTLKNTHSEAQCESSEFCDIHDRRGRGVSASWPLNWRGGRGIMEVICPHGVGHPTPAQIQYSKAKSQKWDLVHGCDGCCSGFGDE